MRLKTFNFYINEELEFELPVKKLKEIENKFVLNLNQYKEYITDNIKKRGDKVVYKDFDNIDINMILSQLEKEFGKEIVTFFNTETFLRKIHQLLELKGKRTKEGIESEFNDYYQSLEERVNEYIEGEKSILSRRQYEDEKYQLQIELAKLQECVYNNCKRLVMVFEGRDSAG